MGKDCRPGYPPRLVIDNSSLEVPRRNAQSTSGLTCSHFTDPPDSRSKEIARDSPNRASLVESTLRMYPTEVPQRLANDSCSSVESEFKYSRSGSMSDILLNGKIVSIPFRNLLTGNDRYDSRMDRKAQAETRFRNFDELIKRYDGSPKRFCEETGYKDATVISQLKGRKRSFGAVLARQIEEAARIPKYSLENEAGISAPIQTAPKQPANWPFSVSLNEIMNLKSKTRQEIDSTLTRMVLGAQAEDLLNRPKKKG